MAPKQPWRTKKKSWVRGEPQASSGLTGPQSRRVWTRPGADSSAGAASGRQATAAPTEGTAHTLPAQRQASRPGPRSSAQAQRPLPHVGCRALANGLLRQGSQGNSAPPDAPAATATAAGGTPPRYVRRERNQLTLNGSHPQTQAADQLQAQHAPAQMAKTAGLAPAGDRQPSHPQSAATRDNEGGRHPRAALQQQMAELAAALGGRAGKPTHRPATAVPAAAPQMQHRQLAATKPRGPPASKRWVRPELAAAESKHTTAVGTFGSATLQSVRRQGFSCAAAPAAASTPCSAYRPALPAWALRGFRARDSNKAAGTPATLRRLSAKLQGRRKARTWVRQDSQDGQDSRTSQGSTHVPAQAGDAASQTAPQSKAHTWRREPDAAGATAEPSKAEPRRIHGRQVAARASMRLGSPSGGQAGQLPVGKPAAKRPAKLQRIGDHMYRVGGGKGSGRTLQRQAHTPAPAATTPAEAAQQMSVRKAMRYAVRGKHRRVLIRRLSGAPSSPASPRSSNTLRLKLRPRVGSGSSVVRKPKSVSRLGRKLRAKVGKLPAQIYCTDFCRTGECKQRQRCRHVHDPAKVAVCPKWLQGHCEDASCKLQHWHRPELMPVCTFFLQGACSKTDCPYLHVNLDPEARMCEAFLRGWCPAGVRCRQKHLTPDMVRRLRRERTLQPGAQAIDKLQRRKRKRYFESDAADIAEADTFADAAGEGEAALLKAAAVAAAVSDTTDSDGYESEYEEAGLAWGDFMEV